MNVPVAITAQWPRRLLILSAIAAIFWGMSLPLVAQQEPAPEPPAGESLTTKQEALSLRYQRFETTLLQLAEYLRKTDPDRAELLVRALGRSKENRIPDQLVQLVELLRRDQLGDAIDSQETLVTQMQDLLTLLQSEDRQSDIEKERARIAALIKNVDKLIGRQTDVRANTERGLPAGEIQPQQKNVSDETQKLIDKINEQDAEKRAAEGGDRTRSGQPSDQKPGDQGQSKPGDSPEQSPMDKPNEGAPKGEGPSQSGKSDKPKDANQSPNDKPPSEQSPDRKPSSKPEEGAEPQPGGQSQPQSGKPQKSQPGQSQPMPSQDQGATPPNDDSGESQPSPAGQQAESPRELPQTPGRKELEQARKDMERAIEELQRQQRDEASGKQDEALANLLKAKEKLEEILRQLREEEKELMLAAMEARFRDMLGRQIAVHNGTLGLAAIPDEQRSDRHRTRSIELARQQDEVALLAAKALTLLKEDGSSIAFPEAVEQIRGDMLTSARRLERADVGPITQGIQRDIVESLEEILDALQKELEKSKDQRKQQQPPQQGQPQQPGLVDGLAELKMLRSLQYRVNRRTRELGRLVDGEQSRDPDVVDQLQELSHRQAKIQRTAADLASGRNR